MARYYICFYYEFTIYYLFQLNVPSSAIVPVTALLASSVGVIVTVTLFSVPSSAFTVTPDTLAPILFISVLI